METQRNNRHLRPVLSQIQNNATLWVGHFQAELNDHLAGQTFTCPGEGVLDNIQVYATAVHQPGDVALTLHEFDPANQSWGPAIRQSHKAIHLGDDASWLRFEVDPLDLEQDKTYGFRIQTNDAFIGLGEAASKSQQPFTFGCAWNSDTINKIGNFFRYFSLTFKVEMCA